MIIILGDSGLNPKGTQSGSKILLCDKAPGDILVVARIKKKTLYSAVCVCIIYIYIYIYMYVYI